MSLNLIQCRYLLDESCDDHSTIELFSNRDLDEETYCLWAVLGDCEKYHPLEETTE